MNVYDPQAMYDDLMAPPPRYVATGNTYPHRDKFTACGWHWDTKRQAWIEENGSAPDDMVILWVKDLPGVHVEQEPIE